MNFPRTSDVLIIGGGVIGLSLARELRKKGAGEITILERAKIGRESSFAAAGMLAPNAEAEKLDDFYNICSESKNLYPNFAEQLFAETEINIELDRNGTLYLAFSETEAAEIFKRFEWQKKSGLNVERLSAEEVRKTEPFISPDVREGLFFADDWHVENRKLLVALQKYAELNNIEILENTEVRSLIVENDKVIGAETFDKRFFAETIVAATGAWTSLITLRESEPILSNIKPIRGQILSFKTAKRLFSKVIYSPAGYLVPRADGRILIGATIEDAGFDKSVTEKGINFLREIAVQISPGLGNLGVFDQWAGLRPFAIDGLPILGELTKVENLFIATAHYRNGILLAPLTAKILAEKILENKNSKYLETFSPQRLQAN